jgi:hypothetical protein
MSKTIILPTYGGLHFGDVSELNHFENCYFEKFSSKNKAIILSIKYEPDGTYWSSDGYAGNCWTARVSDYRDGVSTIITYIFRNFNDLVIHYEKKEFRFVNTKKY